MRLTEWSINRPKMAGMVFILCVFLGLICAPRLGVDLWPPVNIPYIYIATPYNGVSPAEIETQIVKPVEEAVASINNIKSLNSTAYEGLAITVVEFKMGTNLDAAAVDIQKDVDGIRSDLPEGAGIPIIKKLDFNAAPVMVLALSGDLPPEDIYSYAQDKLKDQLLQIPGVAEVTLAGGREAEIKVDADQHRMDSYGLTLGMLMAELSAANLNLPAGRVDLDESEYSVRLLGEFTSLQQIKDLSLTLPSGGKIRLSDVASVTAGFKDTRSISRLDGEDAIIVSVLKQSSASQVSTADGINRKIAEIRKTLPEGARLTVAYDNSTFIHQSLNDTAKNLIEGIILTALVLLLFLREWRSSLIVVLAIPTSLISTFTMMYFVGFSFNIVSLLAMTICIGILVDDSIVVLENIHRHRRQLNKDPAAAALDGRSEIGMAAIAITMSDVVVFAPIALMTGMVGQFFKQFGLTVVFATLFSLLVSFTLTPMLAAILFRNSARETLPDPVRDPGSGKSLLSRTKAWYENLLRWGLGHRKTIVAICLLAPMLVFALLPLRLVKTEFLPRSDQSQLTISLEMPPGTSLSETSEALKLLERKALTMPEVIHAVTTVGRSGEQYLASINAQNGSITLSLSPKGDRQQAQWDIAEEMREWGRLIPGGRVSVFEPSGIHPQMAPVLIHVAGPDPQQLETLASAVQDIVETTPGATDVASSWELGQPEIQAKIDRASLDYYGLSVKEVAVALRRAITGEVATIWRQSGQETDVRVALAGARQMYKDEIANLGIMNQQGQLVRLNQLATIEINQGPTEIQRLNQQRLITVQANVTGRPLGEVTKDIRQEIDALALPPGFTISYMGETQELEDSFAELVTALIISILLVYAILVMLYDSFLVPVIRMLSLPLGMVGALLALAVTGNTLNILSFIGLIMLDGLVAKNSTLLIDYTHTIMEREHLPLREALVRAGTTRLRPILMTSMTMIAGMLPTALAVSAGSEMRSGMAVALIGGLLLSTLLTLVVIPVAYTLLDDLQGRFSARHKSV